MRKYIICTMKCEDGFNTKVYDTLEEARTAADERAIEESRNFTVREKEKYSPYVLISEVEVDEDGEETKYIDSIEAIKII
ncbi:hypothetical protein [Emergencia sp. 1XD21-10]|uniref:hypothetical protein n=1 Tax=Emergencia sp. 1XD21-10 TaxID=2304569 RepID=UPI001379B04C|nr:hypothetical protein [Emergencia sp. 1XD21-10]NCE98100.1 hypothetical protein [Emergencia sp. 1XD21-10]